MLNVVKALFEDDKILAEEAQGEWTPFTDFVSEETLATLHGLFQKYINQESLTENFQNIIKRELFPTHEWQNTVKIMNNRSMVVEEEGILQFLESNCYMYWYPKKHLEGHEFTYHEKSGLAGFSFFIDCIDDADYPHTSPHQEINEQRESSHIEFTKTVFDINLKANLLEYNEFMSRKEKGTVTL
jgi:hypothetical protein